MLPPPHDEMTTAAARTGPSSAIELLRSQSLTTLVQQELERRILAGNILPGDKLNENDVATELNVSRGPVREALRALEQAGLVRTEKNRGVFVRQVSLEEADEIYEVRAGLDELIGRLAAERATDGAGRGAARPGRADAARPGGARTSTPTTRSTSASTTGSPRSRATARCSRPTAASSTSCTCTAGARSRSATTPFPSPPASTREIVEALAARDGTLAGELLYQHAVKSRSRLHEALEQVDIQPPPALVREIPTP